jgi:hypothetical protein
LVMDPVSACDESFGVSRPAMRAQLLTLLPINRRAFVMLEHQDVPRSSVIEKDGNGMGAVPLYFHSLEVEDSVFTGLGEAGNGQRKRGLAAYRANRVDSPEFHPVICVGMPAAMETGSGAGDLTPP